MEKVSEKQGSSAVDISIPMMAAFLRHCSRAAAVSHPDKHSIVTGHCLGCRAVIWTSIIHEGLSTTSDPTASLMPTKQETAQLQQHSTVQGKWFTKVCPVRTNPKSGCWPTEHCSWNNHAWSQMCWGQLVLWVWWWISWWHKHHKQEELPTSFTDRFGTDKKTSKKSDCPFA